MEERPLSERLCLDAANFVIQPEDIACAAITAGSKSFWSRSFGTWGFQLHDGRQVVLQFPSEIDRLIAQRNLAAFLGDKLEKWPR